MTRQDAIYGLRTGAISLSSANSTREEVEEFLKLAFPKSRNGILNFANYYFLNPNNQDWTSDWVKPPGPIFRLSEINEGTFVGYIAPTDFFGGVVKKGSIYKQSKNAKHIYYPENWSSYALPSEIVETWEALYEESEILFTFGDVEIKVTRNGISYQGDELPDNALKAFREMHRKMSSDYASNFNGFIIKFKTVHIGCMEFTEEDVKKVLNAYYKLRKQPLLQ